MNNYDVKKENHFRSSFESRFIKGLAPTTGDTESVSKSSHAIALAPEGRHVYRTVIAVIPAPEARLRYCRSIFQNRQSFVVTGFLTCDRRVWRCRDSHLDWFTICLTLKISNLHSLCAFCYLVRHTTKIGVICPVLNFVIFPH